MPGRAAPGRPTSITAGVAMSVFRPRCAAVVTGVFDARTTSATDNSPPQHIVVMPREASVTQNGYHEADTWTLDFDAKFVPFDPDALASANVRIFMWDEEDGFIGNRLNELSSTFNNPVSSIQEKQQALDNQFGQFEMIRGICDDDDGVMIGEDNTIKLSGRDYTALIMAKSWDPKTDKLTTGDPLDVLVQRLADDATTRPDLSPEGVTKVAKSATSRMQVVWMSTSPIPITGSVFRTSKGKKGALPVKDGKNNWDVIYDIVLQHGFIVYVSGSQVIIADPETLVRDKDGTLKNAGTRLIHGKHLDEFSVKRKFGKDKVPQIIIRTINPDTDAQIEVIYPAKTNVIVDGLAVKKNEEMYFPGPAGVVDPAALLRYAKLMFYYKGRGETTYTFKTHCLAIDNPDGTITSLLRLRTGAPVGIKFDPFNKNILVAMKTDGERYNYIKSLGYSGDIANFAAQNIGKITQYEEPYYLGTAKFDYSVDNGIEIEMTAFNFASQHRETNFANQPTYTLETIDTDAVSSA
jgi:hypothetical protein